MQLAFGSAFRLLWDIFQRNPFLKDLETGFGYSESALRQISKDIFPSMRVLGFAILFVFCVKALSNGEAGDHLLHLLDSVVENRDSFVKAKLDRIDHYKSELRTADEEDQFYLLQRIYEEYKSFTYDSAFLYALKLQALAYKSKDPVKICNSKVSMGFVLVSTGLLNEAFDTLKTVNLEGLPTRIKAQYYYMQARTCYDLADFAQNYYYGDRYAIIGAHYVDSALVLMPVNSINYLILKGLKSLHLRDMDAAKSAYETLLATHTLTDSETAIATSTLSFIYLSMGDDEKSKEMLVRAVIADIRSCTKETVAIRKLAEWFQADGDIESAYTYIKIAKEDADFYGARHRKMQVAPTFSIVEGEVLIRVESRRRLLLIYSLGITVFALLIVGSLIIIYLQNKRLQSARKVISKANETLTETNHQLSDANKIKEEYLWYYFKTTAEYITKMDSLKKAIELRANHKQIEEIRFIAYKINIKKEREDLYHNFDTIFLKLFPGFVEAFNSLLVAEERIVLSEGNLLNSELRIFALIRLGIHDHERIAKILDYSVTTIYTYKARIKNKSIYSSEEFDKQIMKIRTI